MGRKPRDDPDRLADELCKDGIKTGNAPNVFEGVATNEQLVKLRDFVESYAYNGVERYKDKEALTIAINVVRYNFFGGYTRSRPIGLVKTCMFNGHERIVAKLQEESAAAGLASLFG